MGIRLFCDYERKTITLSQSTKMVNLLEKHGMSDCRRSPTPFVPRQQLKAVKYHPELVRSSAKEHSRYMSVVGSIQYIAQVTRPDLSYFAGALARHFSESTKTTTTLQFVLP